MPKINNPYYARFVIQKAEKESKEVKVRNIEFVTPEQLEFWLDDMFSVMRPKGCSSYQARALLILLYYSGCRASEAVQMMPEHIQKVKEVVKGKPIFFYQLSFPVLKNGVQEPFFLAINPHTTELYKYAKSVYPLERVFPSFFNAGKNTVKWVKKREMLVKRISPNGEETITQQPVNENHTKQYTRVGQRVSTYITLWTNRPPHFFRHHRFSLAKAHGWSDEEIKRFKRSKSMKSVEPYVHVNPQYLNSLNKMRNE